MYTYANGEQICLTTRSVTPATGNTLEPIAAFNNGENNITDVVVFISWDITAMTLLSYDASQGTLIDGGDGTAVWEVGTLTPLQNSVTPETLDLCFTVIDNSLLPFEVTFSIDCAECPDDYPENNTGNRLFEGLACDIFTNCITSAFKCLQEFDNMSDALAAIGGGQPFLASLVNTEGWSYRAVIVTPDTIEITCPTNIIDYTCLGGEYFEYVYETIDPIINPIVVTSCCDQSVIVTIETFLDEEATLPCGGENPSCGNCDDIYYEKYTAEDSCGNIASCVRSTINVCC